MTYKCIKDVYYFDGEKENLYFKAGKNYRQVKYFNNGIVLNSELGNFTVNGEINYSNYFEKV